jgi:hypothetical protein
VALQAAPRTQLAPTPRWNLVVACALSMEPAL